PSDSDPPRRSQAGRRDARRLQLVARAIHRLVRNIVKVCLRKTGHLDLAHLQMLPSQLPNGAHLSVKAVARFIADTEEDHKEIVNRRPEFGDTIARCSNTASTAWDLT